MHYQLNSSIISFYFCTSENTSGADPHSHVTAWRLIWQLLPTPFPLVFFLQTCASISALLSAASSLLHTEPVLYSTPTSPGLGRSLAFMRSQCWASGGMTDCLVERTEGPFYVPPPPWIPFEIFIQKLLEPFSPHQTLDPKEKHTVDASTKKKKINKIHRKQVHRGRIK